MKKLGVYLLQHFNNCKLIWSRFDNMEVKLHDHYALCFIPCLGLLGFSVFIFYFVLSDLDDTLLLNNIDAVIKHQHLNSISFI